jgi:peptide/nickel transport system substrate-binding protein
MGPDGNGWEWHDRLTVTWYYFNLSVSHDYNVRMRGGTVLHGCRRYTAGIVGLLLMFGFATACTVAAEPPRYGGVLPFVVSAEPPSFDAHRETTFAVIHPLAPFYSTLIRVNPDNPSDSTDFVGDVALAVPEPTAGGTTYTFHLRRSVRFWDGQPLTARDVVATYNKIIFPPSGVRSARKGFFSMVKTVSASDDHTVVFKLNYPSSAFIPAVANPYNFVYSANRLAQDMHWYETHIMGSGPFIYKGHNPGDFIEGKRNPNYHHAGKPYLDGFRAVFVRQQAQRVQAIRDGQALIEFRGFPPKVRDDLLRQLRHQITVQESDWNCALLATPNHLIKPFDDFRVRRALTLAIDRWGGSPLMARAAIVKTVGGIVFPGHPLAASQSALQQLAGYWLDLDRSRAEARRLLREAGVPDGFRFRFHVRGVDQPYKIVGSWLAGQWRRIGLDPDLVVQPTGPFFDTLRQGTFEVSIDPNCQSVVNPLLDVSKYISNDRVGNNYGRYQDRDLDDLFDRMNRTPDVAEQRRLMRQLERRVLDEEAHTCVLFWWHRIIPHRTVVQGWKISPSHYLNQDLANVWLAQ